MHPNPAPSSAHGAERALALAYAPAAARPGLAALLTLDETLGALVRAARTPMLGQLRLAWWRDALAALDTAPPPAQPVLETLAAHVTPRVAGAGLQTVVDGWEALLDDPADLTRHGEERGAALFLAAARLLGGEGDPVVAAAGRGWALADVARRWSEPGAAAAARAAADTELTTAVAGSWPRDLRALGALALLARADLRGVPPGTPSRVGRLAWHRLTGR